MPTPYSHDLRERVMKHYEQYGSATLTSKVFNISRSIIYDWKKLKITTGSVKAKEGYQKGYGHKIQDLEGFKKCIEQNTDLTLEGIVKKSGIAMSIMTCSRAMKKLNITRKKRPTDLKNATRKREKRT